MKTLTVKPAVIDGKTMVIRDPVTGQPIPAEGVTVPATPFWRTLLRHGDVVAAAPPAPKTAKAKE